MLCQKANNGPLGLSKFARVIPSITFRTELPSALSPNSSPPLQKSRHLPWWGQCGAPSHRGGVLSKAQVANKNIRVLIRAGAGTGGVVTFKVINR